MPSAIGYLNLTLFCLTLSFGAQLVGFSIPGWLHILIDRSTNSYYLYEEVVSQNFALWYAVLCLEGTCQTKSYDQLRKDVKEVSDDQFGYHHTEDIFDYDFTAKESKFPFSRLREFQIEATCALLIVLMGLILVRKQRKSHVLFMSGKRDEEPKQSRHCMTFCYGLVSGTLILVPASHFVEVNTNLSELSDYYTALDFKVATPYALICSGVGGILALLSCLCILGAMCKSIIGDEINNGEAIAVVVNDAENFGHQLVPLVQVDTQPSSAGYADPVAPGYVPTYGNVPNETIVRILTPVEQNGSDLRRSGEFGGREVEAGSQDLSNGQQGDRARNFEQPPPSYEECMQQYNKPS